MPQFDISTFWSQIFWLSGVFCILYIFISKFVVKKCDAIFARRGDYIADNINEAEKFNNETVQLEQKIKRSIDELHIKLEVKRDTLINRFMKNQDNLILDLDKKIKNRNQEDLVEIQKYIDKIRSHKHSHCIELAHHIVHKITDKPVNLKLLNAIYEKYVQN